MTHYFHCSNERCCFPVALRAETVSIGHKPLHRYSRQLRNAVQLFKCVGECVGPGFREKISQAQFNSGCGLKGLPSASLRAKRFRYRISFVVLRRKFLYSRVAHSAYKLRQLPDTISVHGIAQSNLRIDLVAFRHRDVPHVIAQASNSQLLRVMPCGGGSRPSANLGVNAGIPPGSNDDFAIGAHARPDESKFPVAMRRLVNVHEIHVDSGPRQFFVELRV